MKERVILFECLAGSRLYGTSRPESDMDYQGVFMPSDAEFLGLQNPATEWNLSTKKSEGARNQKGDVDRKLFSVRRFLHLAGEGQPGALEMLFAPSDCTSTTSEQWRTILKNRDMFLSRKSVAPFVGFALSQAHKATLKGDSLRLIRKIIEWGDNLIPGAEQQALKHNVTIDEGRAWCSNDWSLPIKTNAEGFTTVEVGGRNYDVGLKTKTFINNLKELEGRYGSRSQAAAEDKYDFKSLHHAYRLLGEAKELLFTGKITLPRPPEEREFLMAIKNKQLPTDDVFADLTARIDELRQVIEPSSPLPEEPDWSRIMALAIHLHRELLG